MRYLFFIILLLSSTGSNAFGSFEPFSRESNYRKLNAGIGMGVDYAVHSLNGYSRSNGTYFAMDLRFHYSPIRQVRVGLSLNGFLIEPFDLHEVDEGMSISESYLQLIYLPFRKTPIFFSIGGGRSIYTTMHSNAFSSHGLGLRGEIGYEWRRKRNLAFFFISSFGFGNLRDIEVSGITYSGQNYKSLRLVCGISF